MGTYKIWHLMIQKEWAWKSIFPLWKRGMKGDFLNNYFHKISPNPSFPKRGTNNPATPRCWGYPLETRMRHISFP
jgi:hypothetical protein